MGYGHLHPPGTTRTIGRRSGAQLLSCLVKNAARSRWSFEVRLKWSSLWLRAWHSCEISWNDGKILRYLRWKEDPGFVKKLHCSAVSASGLTGLTLIQLFFCDEKRLMLECGRFGFSSASWGWKHKKRSIPRLQTSADYKSSCVFVARRMRGFFSGTFST